MHVKILCVLNGEIATKEITSILKNDLSSFISTVEDICHKGEFR